MVAAIDPPKMMMMACSLMNMCRSPPMSIIVATTMMPRHEPDARHDIHGKLQRVREQPAVLDGGAAHPEPRITNPTCPPLKTRKG